MFFTKPLIILLAATFASHATAAAIANPEAGLDSSEAADAYGALQGRTNTCSSYSKMVVDNHNKHRANHSAPALKWDATVAKHAAEWARKCTFAHNTSYGEGQNLALGFAVARDGIQAWYNTEAASYADYYGDATPDMSKFGNYGHFTQMVWKGTQKVGCATQLCRSIAGFTNAQYTVCNYYPPGNYLGSFNTNVGKPKGMSSQTAGVC